MRAVRTVPNDKKIAEFVNKTMESVLILKGTQHFSRFGQVLLLHDNGSCCVLT